MLNNVKSIILKHFPFPLHENKFKMHEGIKYPSMAVQIALLVLLMGLEILWKYCGNIWKYFENTLGIFGNIWKYFGNTLEILWNIWKYFGNTLEYLETPWNYFGNIWKHLEIIWK